MIINSILCVQQSLKHVYLETLYKLHLTFSIMMCSVDWETMRKTRIWGQWMTEINVQESGEAWPYRLHRSQGHYLHLCPVFRTVNGYTSPLWRVITACLTLLDSQLLVFEHKDLKPSQYQSIRIGSMGGSHQVTSNQYLHRKQNTFVQLWVLG